MVLADKQRALLRAASRFGKKEVLLSSRSTTTLAFLLLLSDPFFLGCGAVRRSSRSSSSSRKDEVCRASVPISSVPHVTDAAEQEQAFRFVDRAYGDDTVIADLPDATVRNAADKVGEPWDKACHEDTYGEIPQSSALALFRHLNLSPTDVFADLGCGLGKMVVDAALFGRVRQTYGVELSHKRYDLACVGLSNLDDALSPQKA